MRCIDLEQRDVSTCCETLMRLLTLMLMVMLMSLRMYLERRRLDEQVFDELVDSRLSADSSDIICEMLAANENVFARYEGLVVRLFVASADVAYGCYPEHPTCQNRDREVVRDREVALDRDREVARSIAKTSSWSGIAGPPPLRRGCKKRRRGR